MNVIYFMYEQCIRHHSAKDTFMRLMWYGVIAVVSSVCCQVSNCITCKRLSRLAVWGHVGFTVRCWRAQYYWVSSLPYVTYETYNTYKNTITLILHNRAKAILQSPRPTNINSCFLFVACQDPDLNVCLHQSLNGLRHLILKLVLYRCGPQELQVLRQKWRKTNKKGKKREWVRGDHRRGRSLKHHVSGKHVSQDCVTRSVVFPFISGCL